jgi:glutamine---fructose-6-phosphate transaminase (isomerizing)
MNGAMCGIVGYVGPREARAILIDGLSRLEYRGYDSVGIAVQNGQGMVVRKLAGRVDGLRVALRSENIHGGAGIGHTRWATHGPPTERNAHPHVDCRGEFVVVHNGIIENALALRTSLTRAGHTFRTDTDTEVLAHLLEDEPAATLEGRVVGALSYLEGTFGVAVMSTREPGKLVVARQGSPVLIGIGESEYFVASDAAAVLEHTRSVVYLDDGDVAILTADGFRIIDRQARPQTRSIAALDWDLEAIELGGYPHFMLKEIFEQPETVRNTVRGRIVPGRAEVRLDGLNLDPEACRKVERMVLLGCGTSWHAGLVGRYVLEKLSGIPVQVEYASEYRTHTRFSLKNTLAVALSQSGETADTLDALRAAKESGARVVGLINAVGSTMARESDGGVYLHAGPEIGVASTKAFTSQIVALVLLGLYLGQHRGLAPAVARAMVRDLQRLPDLVARTLELDDAITEIAAEHADAANFLYLGRGAHFPVALEGALKLKEISYIHAEGYPAAEMKHGPIALIDEAMPIVFLAPHDEMHAKLVGNIQEVKARGGRTIVLSEEGGAPLPGLADHQLFIPATSTLLAPIVASIPLQLLAYRIAVLRGCDVDRPRNLAKSVTVS